MMGFYLIDLNGKVNPVGSRGIAPLNNIQRGYTVTQERAERDSQTMGGRIRAARKAKGYGSWQTAKKCNIAANTYEYLEANRTVNPLMSTLKNISVVLGVSIDYLVFGDKNANDHTA